MTKEELMALLRNPDQTGQAVDKLNRLIEENPYFHTGHQLYLQGLKQTDETKMALQLRKTALSVRDRGVLYNYINRPSAFRQQPLIEDDSGEVTAPFVPGNSFISPETDIRNIQQFHTEEPSLPQSLTMSGEWHNTEEHVVADEEIMSNTQLMDVIRRRLEQIDSPQTEEEKQPLSDVEASSVSTADNVIADSSVETTVQENQDVEIRDEYSEDQLVADLIKINPIKTDVVETPPQDIITTEETSTDIESAEDLTPCDLIDSFLKANPKIIPTDSKFQVDLSESLWESQDIATETLADIYATQGHKDKAIEIYQHLILKYPEKHIYLAAQIDRLKE